MSQETTGRSPTAPAEAAASALAVQVRRLADRLRSLSDVRLARPLPPAQSRADAAHALAQRLADHAAALEGGPRREVPRLHDLAVGDQVAVTGADLAAAVRRAPSGWSERSQDALAALRDLRDAL